MRPTSRRNSTAVACAVLLCCASHVWAQDLGRSVSPDVASPLPAIDVPSVAVAQYTSPDAAAQGFLAEDAADDGVQQTSATQALGDWIHTNTRPTPYGGMYRNGSFKELPPVCDETTTHGVYASVGYDSWREISDGSWQNNGIHTAINYGTRLGTFSEWTGIGFQIGGSIGIYDWSGRAYTSNKNAAFETQGFVTYGFFRKANDESKWSAAVVQDWMITSNFGQYAQNPTLAQWRGQVAYATSAANEYGLWGTLHDRSSNRYVPGEGPTSWRALDQLNLFWHHKWTPRGADTSIWIGVPQRSRLTGDGSLGDWLAGAQANVPLSDRVGLYTLVTYMHPSAHPGPEASTEEAWNFTVGISFYPGRNARSTTVAGQCWMPLMPVANNGYFWPTPIVMIERGAIAGG